MLLDNAEYHNLDILYIKFTLYAAAKENIKYADITSS